MKLITLSASASATLSRSVKSTGARKSAAQFEARILILRVATSVRSSATRNYLVVSMSALISATLATASLASMFHLTRFGAPAALLSLTLQLSVVYLCLAAKVHAKLSKSVATRVLCPVTLVSAHPASKSSHDFADAVKSS